MTFVASRRLFSTEHTILDAMRDLDALCKRLFCTFISNRVFSVPSTKVHKVAIRFPAT